MDDLSLYVNFILHAVLGRLRKGDALMRMHGAAIRRSAHRLRAHFRFERKPLHRGILLDGAFDATGREFVSWSESADVAEWFADPRSMMNEYVMSERPKSVGYLLTSNDGHRVLFHHSWVARIGDPSAFVALAALHPEMGIEGSRQIAWSLQTQHEVITEPPRRWPELRPLVAGRDLDEKLAPPWMYRFAKRCTFCHAPTGEPCRTVLYEEHIEHGNGVAHDGTHIARSWAVQS